MARGGMSLDEAQSRIASQMPQEEKMRYADFLIDTSGDKANTRQQTVKVYASLKTINDLESAAKKD
jgi:dephospho-CoA kinase